MNRRNEGRKNGIGGKAIWGRGLLFALAGLLARGIGPLRAQAPADGSVDRQVRPATPLAPRFERRGEARVGHHPAEARRQARSDSAAAGRGPHGQRGSRPRRGRGRQLPAPTAAPARASDKDVLSVSLDGPVQSGGSRRASLPATPSRAATRCGGRWDSRSTSDTRWRADFRQGAPTATRRWWMAASIPTARWELRLRLLGLRPGLRASSLPACCCGSTTWLAAAPARFRRARPSPPCRCG